MKRYNLTYHTLMALVFAIALACGTSCSSHRKASTAAPAGRVAAKRSPEVASLTESYKPWQSVQMPFTLRCASPMSISLSGRATMVRDECIYLSLRMLGMEVGQVWIDSDSVFVSEKLGKTLVAEPLSQLTAHTGLTIGDLQALLLGQAFYPGGGVLNDPSRAATLFSVTTADDVMLMTPRRTPEGATWYFTIEAGPVLDGVTVEPVGMKEFKALFSDVVDSPAGKIASDVRLSGSAMSKSIDAGMYWNPSKATWNETSAPTKPVWRGYRRMGARQMLEALKKSF